MFKPFINSNVARIDLLTLKNYACAGYMHPKVNTRVEVSEDCQNQLQWQQC